VIAFWDCCGLEIFSYTGAELVAVTAPEAEYPRYDVPQAVRRVAIRLFFYYTVAIFILGVTVSSNDPMLTLSNDVHPNYPGGFVVMAQRAGLPVVAHLINAAMVIATLSVATGDIYVVVRILFSWY